MRMIGTHSHTTGRGGAILSFCWLCAAMFLILVYPGIFHHLNYTVYDAKLGWFVSDEPNTHTVHLDVDDDAILRFGQWPWDRSMSAAITERLTELGARAVVFDVLYSSEGRSREGDRQFAESVRSSGNVVCAFAAGAIALGEPEAAPELDEMYRALYAHTLSSPCPPGFTLYSAVELRNSGLPFPELLKAVAGIGHINSTADGDGIHRRVPLVIRVGERLMPSLSVAAIMRFLKAPPEKVALTPDFTLKISHSSGDLRIPLRPDGTMNIRRHLNPRNAPCYTVWDIFDLDPDPGRASRYKDKIVIIGVAATGNADIGSGPVDKEVPLCRVHSAAIETILNGEFIREFPAVPYTVFPAVCAALLYGLWERRLGFSFAAALAAVISVGFVLISVGCFALKSWEIPVAEPLCIFLPASLVCLTARAVTAEMERREVRKLFGVYMSEEVVKEILKSPGTINRAGEMRDVTILVCDLRGYTPITESFHPAIVLRTLNGFLDVMTDIIFRHNGTINEVMGDGLLVFFGAPNEMADQADTAVGCALEMQKAMPALNENNRQDGLPELGMGIGINSGRLIVGNIGSQKRMKYGAVGSAINVAFRVESRTKAGEILVTAGVHERLIGRPKIADSRLLTLKGVSEPTVVHQIIDLEPSEVRS